MNTPGLRSGLDGCAVRFSNSSVSMREPASKNRLRKLVIMAAGGFSVLMFSGCGSSSPPGGPTPPPAIPQVSGSYLGEQTLTSHEGGECFGPVFDELLGMPSEFRATLTQSGNTVTATSDIDHTGATCTYSGSITGDTLELTVASCTDSKVVAFQCGNGALRDLLPGSQTIRATVNGNRITGMATESDQILATGTSTKISTWIGSSSFMMTRQ